MVLILAATACFSTMQVLIRTLALDVPVVEVAFFRSVFGLALQAPLIFWFGFAAVKTSRVRLHVVRGTVHAISMVLFFIGLTMVPMAEATSLEFAAPILSTVIAILFLGEAVHARRLFALGAGVCGVLIVVRPGFESISTGQLLILVSVALWAACQLMIRELAKTESSFVQGVYMAAVFTPLTLLASLPVWVWPDLKSLAGMLVVAIVATAGTWLYGEAFRRAEMSAILPLESTKLIWSVSYGWIFFSEQPEVLTLVGGMIIFSAAAYITIREAQLARVKGV